MKASVVISSYSLDRLPDVMKATDSVLRQTYRDREVILVVDSNPELYSCLRRTVPDAVRVVLSNEAKGLSTARNAGVDASRGEVVVFLDDDAIADDTWLERLMDNYLDPVVIAAGGKALPVWEGKRPLWLPEELFWVVGCTYRGYAEGKKTSVRNIHGNTMSFRREVFGAVGGFSTEVGYVGTRPTGGEETEFCMRLSSQFPEARIIYDPGALISHKVPARRCTVGYLFKRSYGEGVAKAIINHISRHRGPIEVEVTYLRYLLFEFVPRGLRRLFSRDFVAISGQIFAVGLSICATALGYLVTRGKIILKRNRERQPSPSF